MRKLKLNGNILLEVVMELKKERKLLQEMEFRKTKFMGHIIRHNDYQAHSGRQEQGRPRKAYLEDINMTMGYELPPDEWSAEIRGEW